MEAVSVASRHRRLRMEINNLIQLQNQASLCCINSSYATQTAKPHFWPPGLHCPQHVVLLREENAVRSQSSPETPGLSTGRSPGSTSTLSGMFCGLWALEIVQAWQQMRLFLTLEEKEKLWFLFVRCSVGWQSAMEWEEAISVFQGTLLQRVRQPKKFNIWKDWCGGDGGVQDGFSPDQQVGLSLFKSECYFVTGHWRRRSSRTLVQNAVLSKKVSDRQSDTRIIKPTNMRSDPHLAGKSISLLQWCSVSVQVWAVTG